MSALGVCFGILVHTLAAAIGLSALLMTSTLAYKIVKYAGAAYLIYLGIRVILSRKDHASLGTLQQASLATVFSQGVISNVLNPKVALFFLAFLPQFVHSSQGSVAWQMITLGLIFVAMTILWLMIVALLTGSAGQWLQKRSRQGLYDFSNGLLVAF